MNWLGNPRVDRADSELWALAVSAINGCGPAWTPLKGAATIRRQLGHNSNGRALSAIVQSVAVAIKAARSRTAHVAE